MNGLALARALARIRSSPKDKPLPRITGLDPDQRLALEHELVDRSICYARDRLGLV